MGHAQGLELHVPGAETRARFAALLDPRQRRVEASDVCVIVAHPDDEIIECDAHLARWIGATIVLVTDGAPADGKDAQAAGFASTADYARARRRELETALEIAGVRGDALIALDIPDQQVAWRLVETTHRLTEIVANRCLSVFFAHAYEGGHPDHDGTAIAVHAAARLLERHGQAVFIVENGVPIELFVSHSKRRFFALVLACIAPEKGIREALKAAHLADLPMLMLASYFPIRSASTISSSRVLLCLIKGAAGSGLLVLRGDTFP
jgi:LmbE family N-acetylglucosaminyl deacetylase